MKCLIVSRKYNYGHLCLLLGWAQLLLEINIEPVFFLDRQYERLFTAYPYKCIYSYKELIKKSDFDYMIINNISIEDSKCIKLLKTISDVKILFYYHEPWRGFKAELKHYPNDLKGLCMQIARVSFARLVIKEADVVLCPSAFAADIYSNNEARINANYKICPLPFMDEAENISYSKKYFSFISTANLDKGIDHFFSFIKYASKIDNQISFCVCTKTDISEYIDYEIKDLISSNRLLLQHGRILEEEEINEAYNNSLCTWLCYKSSTQSGVLVKTFMWGSPCVATPVGVFPNQINGLNGVLVNSSEAYKEIYSAYKTILNDSTDFIKNSRLSYETLYSPKKLSEVFLKIINSIS
ncbi:MAG: hypothetical protein ACI4AQ_02385 [Lachnospiraceae bacterium]